MHPCDGKTEVVNAASDEVVQVQSEIEKKEFTKSTAEKA
jgi:hypothetical protein